MTTEEHAIVLDYMPKGKGSEFKESPLAQIMGIHYFTLLEAIPRADIRPMQKVYIGKEKREEISLIKRRIRYKDLTASAVAELENAVEKIMEENPQRALDFFNNSTSVSLRLHQLELLPGIGQKQVQHILDAREQKPFESLKDITDRVHGMTDPFKAVIRRIMKEIESEEDLKYYLFARKPVSEAEMQDAKRNRRSDFSHGTGNRTFNE